ncbi:hypothetical protein [Anaerococcus prevotii]|uniref:Conserved domain protein n=1 Tax=Anaerococcus prevotii ACS-065-V-Col13 TaxID=879305 RepID=F0GTI5_9FIRM|nr:hypothetical protein [Anaerococcus prevotii]EGC82869.1 conserved domain protein [Anaerococcus prevotii ACS-065-V-Col13]
MKFDMDYKKFMEYFAKFSLGLMIVAGMYILIKPATKKVTSYKVNEDMTYTGKLVHGKFEGNGVLATKDGLYKGDFSNGRFVNDGIFIGKDYYYIKKDDTVTIKYNNGRVFVKEKDKWKEVDSDEN